MESFLIKYFSSTFHLLN